MAIEITGTGRALPSRRMSNEELSARIDTSDEWIRSHTGIGNRFIADIDTACSDLALSAAKNALAMAAGYDGNCPADVNRAAAEMAESIDMIVLGTATPDFPGCPSTACIVQEKLNARNSGAMDISAGCTGFIYGLETAACMLASGAGRKRALVIGSEVLSRALDWEDRGTCVIFGDGAGAVVIEKTGAPSQGPGRRGLVRSLLCADGSGSENLIFKKGGSRFPFAAGETIDKPIHVTMKGQEVYYFAVKALAETIEKLLVQENITMDDVKVIVPHQANIRIIRSAAKSLGIPMEKFYVNIEEYANTSAASIPIALDELNRNKRLANGDLIITAGFGGGFTYGGNIIVW
ncbi:MAG: ketoacyl-ACP synthase III [Treponema sp.]|nr:ketoacyl-ACP synthase III [Treponema sp.]